MVTDSAVSKKVGRVVRNAPWPMVPLGEVGRWFGGGTPSKSNPRYWTDGTIPWVSPKDMKQPLIDDAQDYITEAAVEESSTNMVEVGSVLVVARSGILQHTLPVAITTRRVALNQDIKAIEPRKDVAPRFLAVALKAFEQEILHTCTKTGTTVQSLELPLLQRFCIPIPPLADQRRIVAEIEKQSTRLDAGVAALRRVQANLKCYRAAVLKAACEGRLVPTEAELARKERRPFESGDQLLQRILTERRKSWTGRGSQKGPAIPDPRQLATLPAGWAWASLDALAAIKGGITKDQKRKHSAPARSVPYLRVANVQRGYLDLTEIKAITTTESDIEQLRLQPGDILLNEGGDRDKLGRGWVWNGEISECIHQNHVFRARLLLADLNPKYVSWYANTFGQKFFFDEGKHTTNLASISMTKLKALPVPIPPPAEQKRIVAEVERRMSVIDDFENAVSENLNRSALLRRSILRQAFVSPR